MPDPSAHFKVARISIIVGVPTLACAFHESTGHFSLVAPARVAAIVEGISIFSHLCVSVRSSVMARRTLLPGAVFKAKLATGAGIAAVRVLEAISEVVCPSIVCAGRRKVHPGRCRCRDCRLSLHESQQEETCCYQQGCLHLHGYLLQTVGLLAQEYGNRDNTTTIGSCRIYGKLI